MVNRANTPTLDWLAQNALAAKLKAHGTAVGMPSDADMDNSEIGHNAIASGGGRMKITMDHYQANWGMVELGYKTHVLGVPQKTPPDITIVMGVNDDQLKPEHRIVSWYDNEWGYSNRVVDLIGMLAAI